MILPLAAATASFLAGVTPAPAVEEFPVGQLALNLLIVCVLLGLMAWAAMAVAKGKFGLPIGLRAKTIKVEDRLPIDPQRALMVVSVGGRRWLVGMTNYSFNAIAELDAADFEKLLSQEVGT